jgi:hypothetical protein
MDGAREPDGGRGRDGERDAVPEAPRRAEDGPGDPPFVPLGGYTEESDQVGPYGEVPEYVADSAVEEYLRADPVDELREAVVAREEERFGGIKIGSAFFGWLTAISLAVLLCLLAASAVRAGMLSGPDMAPGTAQSSSSPVGLSGLIILLAILVLSFFAGGYVAGRMARVNGVGQGLMVWLWGLIGVAAVVALAIFGGGQFNVLTLLNSFLRLPINEGPWSASGTIAGITLAATALVGAVLGGLAGVHYHRKIDRVGFAPTEGYYQS